ncbi:MAG: sodium:proton antiporter [Coxiellaceae bacterium]|nr:sodium:proton antiporter [Coxiellaceae bacterium]
MNEKLILILVSIAVISLICQWVAWRVKLPAILFLIIFGLILGPGMHWLRPQEVFGDLMRPLVDLSVSVVLFEASLTLNFREIKGQRAVVRNLISIGILTSWLLAWLFIHWIFGLSWAISCLFGAILSISGPTVILPLLRSIQAKKELTNIMRWEGILIDPIGAILAVLIFTTITQTQSVFSHTLYEILEVIIVGFAGGAIGGWVLAKCFIKYWIPEFLQNIASLVFVITLYTITNHFMEGAGLLAVTVMGIWMANMKDVHIEDILNFKASVSILLISVLFIVLSAEIKFAAFSHVILPSFLLFLALQFIVRPISVIVSTIGSELTWKERALMSWISPKGIICAAVAAIFTIQLCSLEYLDSEAFILVTFLIILFTVIFQSLTSRLVARLLGVANPEPTGYLLVGANVISRQLALALQQHGFNAMIVDGNWNAISEARMEGIPVFYGNPVSEYTDRRIDLVGLGNVIGLSPRQDLNALSCLRYSKEFGKGHCFMLATENRDDSEKIYAEKQKRASLLFGNDISFSKLASLIAKGAQIKSTKLTAEFTLENFIETNANNAIPFFIITTKGKLRFFIEDTPPKPEPGDTLVSLSYNT